MTVGYSRRSVLGGRARAVGRRRADAHCNTLAILGLCVSLPSSYFFVLRF